jgi:hypothetical protein
MLQGDVLAGGEGEISNANTSIVIHPDQDDGLNVANKTYAVGLMISTKSGIDYAGTGTVTFDSSQRATIAFSQFKDMTNSIPKDPDPTSQATITITNIPSYLRSGKGYQLGLFPVGTTLATMLQGDVLAGGEGEISNANTSIVIHSDQDDGLNVANKTYAVGIMISAKSGIDYAGTGTVTFDSSQRATIAFSQFKDMTNSIPKDSDPTSQATITITNIPSKFTLGQELCLRSFPGRNHFRSYVQRRVFGLRKGGNFRCNRLC